MAIQKDLAALSSEVIEEYLAIAEHCVTTQKAPGAIYGYPATLLLFCTVDAMTVYLGGKNNTFTAFNEPLFSLCFSSDELKRLANLYRHLLAHAAAIAPGVILTPEDSGDAFEFNVNEPTRIRVPAFYHLVKKAWGAFDKSKLKPEDQLKRKQFIAKPIDLSGASTAFLMASSGAPMPPIEVK